MFIGQPSSVYPQPLPKGSESRESETSSTKSLIETKMSFMK